MDKSLQIAVDILLEKIREKTGERDSYLDSAQKIQSEVNALQKALEKIQGKERKKRSDKGVSRKNTVEIPFKRTYTGRVKQVSILKEFVKKATFRQKIVFAISTFNRFVHNREIAEYLHSKDSSNSVDNYVEKLSAVASIYKKEKTIVAYQVNGSLKNTFYGLPEWLSNGEIKKGFEYNKQYLIGNDYAKAS